MKLIDRNRAAGNQLWHMFGPAQLVVCLLALGSLLLAPPANGQMALYPLTDTGRHDLARVATSDGRAIISTTPLSGGLVILGDRPEWLSLLLDHGILAIAVERSGCIGTVKA